MKNSANIASQRLGVAKSCPADLHLAASPVESDRNNDHLYHVKETHPIEKPLLSWGEDMDAEAVWQKMMEEKEAYQRRHQQLIELPSGVSQGSKLIECIQAETSVVFASPIEESDGVLKDVNNSMESKETLRAQLPESIDDIPAWVSQQYDSSITHSSLSHALTPPLSFWQAPLKDLQNMRTWKEMVFHSLILVISFLVSLWMAHTVSLQPWLSFLMTIGFSVVCFFCLEILCRQLMKPKKGRFG